MSSRSEANPFPRHHYKRTFAHCIRMVLNDFAHGVNLLNRAHFDEANDARVWQAAHEDQFAEVLVFRDEHSSVLVCKCQEGFIRSL